MLKAQLHSKFFHVDEGWREDEDILTGDFFGILDYLPRSTFLSLFLRQLHPYEIGNSPIEIEDIDWNSVEFHFWPMTFAEDAAAEPDLIVISNRWLLVVEVKLDSGLGHRQPWREYVVGKQIARERRLTPDCVRYLVVARGRLNISETFGDNETCDRDELMARCFYIRWCDVVTLVESWLRYGAGGQPLLTEQNRMLEDMLRVMRKRRNIAFEGFAFTNQRDVILTAGRFFCPPSFEGFLVRSETPVDKIGSPIFLAAFNGFLNRTSESVEESKPWPVASFSGFIRQAKRCRPQPTLLI
jgi:hypothetical protein